LLGPEVLGLQAPRHKDLVRYSEGEYAHFCWAFERAITAEILRNPPGSSIVLSNDVCEGPNFRLLAQKGYRVFVIYHLDVIDYFLRIYLRGWIRPQVATRWEAFLSRFIPQAWWPNLLRLLFEKQRDSLVYSQGVTVPSQDMKRILTRCYPQVSPDKIHVLPWGIWQEAVDEARVQHLCNELRVRYLIPADARVLLTLSRISPEKGQDRLLRALRLWEQRGNLPEKGLWVLICGEAAYMRGEWFMKHLQSLARRLKQARVVFPGYVAGELKQALFRLADLYVFPSRHESYGLTLLEALQAGLPAVACAHYGAQETLQPDFGELIPTVAESQIPDRLQKALQRLLSDRQHLQGMRPAAKAFAATQPFNAAAGKLAEILTK
jgi:glycosyltransferase involved in cell wall biosynthesis